MTRPLRIEYPGAVYHVTSRGNAQQLIYKDDTDREGFLTTLSHVVGRYDWRCHAYCLMDNHYHLLIETPMANLSLGMRQLNGIYTQSYNRRHRKVGHLLQGRFKSILVEKEAHLLELCRYVVLNPVRAKAVKHPGKWKWSSYLATAGQGRPPKYLRVNWILEQFGKDKAVARKQYRAFVRGGHVMPGPWEKVQGQIYLGGESFVKKHQPDRPIQEIARRQTQAHRPGLKDLFEKTDRDHAIMEAYRRYGYRLSEIAKHLNLHYSTISRRLKRIEKANA